MRISNLIRGVGEGINNISNNRVMSLASIISIILALVMLGSVVVVVINLQGIMNNMQSMVELTAYISNDADNDDVNIFKDDIKNVEGVIEVIFKSRDEALKEWKDSLADNEELLEGYDETNNPLPDAFVIRVEKVEYIQDVLKRVESYDIFEKINHNSNVTDLIAKTVSITRVAGITIVAVLAIIAIIIINNTVKIAIYSNRRQINIMKYVGATDWYIRWPYVVCGLVFGITGAIISAGLVLFGYYMLVVKSGITLEKSILGMFELLPISDVLWQVITVSVFFGSVISILASVLSLHRHLRV